MAFGTIRNPLTVGASGQSDGSAYRALAESLAAQQGQAGPSSGLNALNAVLGVLAQQTNLKRASEADSAFESQRMKEYQDFMAQQEKAKAMAAQAGKQAERADLEKLADEGGFKGPLRAAFIANNGQLPADALIPRQQDGYDAWLANQSPEVQAQAYQVKAGLAPRAQAPGQGPGPSEMDRKVAQLRALGASDEQIRQSLLGSGGATQPRTPSGYARGPDGKLAYEPNGPADPEVIAHRQQVASAAKQEPGINDALAAFANLRAMVEANGTEQLPFGENKAKMKAAYGTARDAIRVLSNSGVLNVGELPYLEERLNDPTAWTSLRAGPILSQIDENMAMLNAKKGRLDEMRGGGQQPAAGGAPQQQGGQTKAGPVGSVQVINGKKYRVVGGDPNDPDLEPVG